MARLVYSMLASLDGFVADATGNFDWAAPDEEVHRFVNERERPIGTYLYGRRMYEVMAFWEAPPDFADQPGYIRDYARIWQAADKVVFSASLASVTTRRTRLERVFDPDAVRHMKAAAGRDLSVGGPELAGHALRAGLVDECELLIAPTVVGSGRHWLPGDLRIELELLDEHRFGNGMVALRYEVVG